MPSYCGWTVMGRARIGSLPTLSCHKAPSPQLLISHSLVWAGKVEDSEAKGRPSADAWFVVGPAGLEPATKGL